MIRKTVLVMLLWLAAMPVNAAVCYISEYSTLARDAAGRNLPVASQVLAVQAVTYTTSTQSSAFNAATRFIRLVCDAAAFFEFGASPTATTADAYLPGNTVEYFGVLPGEVVALYDGTS